MKEKKWYQKISNWLFIVAILILVPILITNINIMFQANTEKDKVPNIFGYKPFIVLSGSMETEIQVGDLIITKMTDPKTLKKEDVIAFRDHENTVTTHRIIDIIDKDGKKYFITKGDNNDSQDENLVEYEDVEGIYVTRIPGVGNIFNELAKPTTIIILVLGITVIFILLFQISNKKLKEQEQKEFLEYKKQKQGKKEKSKTQLKKEERRKHQQENQQQKRQEQQRKQEENKHLEKQKQEEQEFLEYKRMKEEQQKQKEEQEFLEFKRMKEEKQKEQERQEFLEYKKMMEEKKKPSQEQFSKNTNPHKKHNYNKNAKYNDVRKHQNQKYNKNKKYNNKNTSK